MSRRSCWQPFEDQVLKERSVADAARIFNRNPEEVERKANEFFEATLEGWYGRHRCSGSPINPAPVVALADQIFTDYPGLGQYEDYQFFLYEALKEAFSHFDPAQGNPHITVERRFGRFIRHILRRRLARACERQRIRLKNEQRATRRLHKNMLAKPNQAEIGVYTLWAKALYEVALSRIDPRMRAYLELRNSNRSVSEIAGVMGVSTKTLSNSYGLSSVVRRFQKEVSAVVMGLPESSRRGIVAHLLFEGGLTLAQVGRLLCVPTSLLDIKGWEGPAPNEDAALRLLRGTGQVNTFTQEISTCEGREVCGDPCHY